MFDTLVNRVLELAGSQPDKTAIAFKKETLTYAELKRRMLGCAAQLKELGVKKGDFVAFSAVSKPEMGVVYLAVHYIGAAAVFIDKNATPDNACFICKDTAAAIFLTDKPMKGHEEECRLYSLRKIYADSAECSPIADAYSMPEPDTLAELIYTSGTTGVPKGVMLTYKSVYNIFINTINGIGMRSDERVLIPLPLNHSFALRVFRATLYLGATVVLQNGFTFAKDIETNQQDYDCTAIAIVPASVETITKQMQGRFPEIMGKFRYIEVSAGSLTVEQRKRLTKQLPNTLIFNTWGSSESGGALFLNVTEVASDPVRVMALGQPLNCVDIKTLDEDGREFVSSREHPGRMTLRGDMQMVGYWNRPEVTADTLRDGWLLTGDMIYIEDDYVYMLGRADDIINVGGEKVSPIEVENLAGEYPGIAECACIGVPDPEGVLGFVPCLFYVAAGNILDKDDIVRFLSQRMEKYKIPAVFFQLLEIPRNRMQKIDRKALKEIYKRQNGKSLINETAQIIFTRRSIRKFDTKPIPRELLDIILMSGYYAPTGHNMQTWRFTVLNDTAKIQHLKEVTAVTAKANKEYLYGFDNPVTAIIVSNDERNHNSCQDSSCAAENIMLTAWSYGIGSVWINAYRNLRHCEPLSSLLDSYGIPENHRVWTVILLGYPLSNGTLLKKKTDVVKWID